MASNFPPHRDNIVSSPQRERNKQATKYLYKSPEYRNYLVPNRDDRGIGVIFTNEKFVGTSQNDRQGVELDRRYLRKMFKMMRLTIYQYKDKKSHEILAILKDLAKSKVQAHHCVLFVAFSTHGDEGDNLYGHDSCSISLRKDILPLFKPNNCRALEGKPKLFLIQACRGNKTDRNIVLRDAMVKEEQVKSAESDILISYACVQEYAAYRTQREGAWFLKDLFKTYELFYQKLHFMDILTLTNQSLLLRSTTGGFNDNIAQPSHIESTLLKFLWLVPESVQDSYTHQEPESPLPQETSRKNLFVKEPVNRDEIIHPRVTPEQYNLCLQECRGETSKFKGLGMIFVSKTFLWNDERDVALSDLQRLQSLFQQMQLRIKIIENPTRYDYINSPERFVKSNTKLSSLFIAISSYRGDGNTILCSDNRSVSVEEIMNTLQMEELIGKPKVLIIEASVRCTTIQSIDNAISIQYNHAKLRDILLAYSCIPDYIPPNTVDTSEGSWFITSVLEAYEKFKGGNEDLFRILTSANDFKPSQSCTIVIQSTLNKLLMI